MPPNGETRTQKEWEILRRKAEIADLAIQGDEFSPNLRDEMVRAVAILIHAIDVIDTDTIAQLRANGKAEGETNKEVRATRSELTRLATIYRRYRPKEVK